MKNLSAPRNRSPLTYFALTFALSIPFLDRGCFDRLPNTAGNSPQCARSLVHGARGLDPRSQGHNLDSEKTCGFTSAGDQINIDPLLGDLQDNGGSTFTHALLAGSPAIDNGDNTGCPKTNQRDFTHPADGDGNRTAVCNIGAFELDGTPPTSTPSPQPIETLSPTPTSTQIVTDTPTAPTTTTPGTTPSPTPQIPPCSSAAIVLTALLLFTRTHFS